MVGDSQAIWTFGALLIAVLGWIIYQVNGNTKTNKDDEKRLTALETDMGWIRNAIKKIAEKLNVTEIT